MLDPCFARRVASWWRVSETRDTWLQRIWYWRGEKSVSSRRATEFLHVQVESTFFHVQLSWFVFQIVLFSIFSVISVNLFNSSFIFWWLARFEKGILRKVFPCDKITEFSRPAKITASYLLVKYTRSNYLHQWLSTFLYWYTLLNLLENLYTPTMH